MNKSNDILIFILNLTILADLSTSEDWPPEKKFVMATSNAETIYFFKGE